MSLISKRVVVLMCLLALPALAVGKSSIVGKTAPNFRALGLDGFGYSLDQFQGKVIMLNFWASWCGPCRQEMPPLENLYRQYRGLGFVVVGVNVDETLEPAKKMIAKLAVSYPNLYDSDKNISRGYNVSTMPMTVIIDGTGKVRYVHHGYKSGYMEKYQREVRQLLAELGR